jgi:hypothetical protein
MMVVFALNLLLCDTATECRWITPAHFVNEQSCIDVARDYQRQFATVMRYKCVAWVREDG